MTGQIADLASIIGLPLALLGLVFTFLQASKARTAAEAAEDASSATADRLLEMRVQVSVAELDRLLDMLSTSVDSDNHQLAAATVRLWESATSRLLGSLSMSDDGANLHDPIASSRINANIAMDALANPNLSVAKSVSQLRRSMTSVVRIANEVAGSAAVKPPAPGVQS